MVGDFFPEKKIKHFDNFSGQLAMQLGGGQFGDFLASQFGELAKSDKVANFSEGCQSGDSLSRQSGNITIEQEQALWKESF